MDQMNIVYCFDSNYNIQAICSINSVLNNIENKVNLYIIHDDPKSFLKDFEKYSNHKNLNSFEVYEFKTSINFPGLQNSHVSEATYYRMYIASYLPHEVKNVIYLDPDVICIKDFSEPVLNLINQLENSDYIISALSTPVNQEMKDTLLKRLMVNEKYFNAGVMIICLEKWRSFNIENKLITRLEEIKDRITYWDQDVLNSFFNGNYLELPKNMNYMLASINTGKAYYNEIEKDVFFVHYAGNLKPWTVKGGLFLTSNYYHKSFRDLGLGSYHIINKYKVSTFYHLMKGIFSFKIFNIQNPGNYIFKVLKLLIK